MMATGMALGAGSAIAHQAIGSMFGHHYDAPREAPYQSESVSQNELGTMPPPSLEEQVKQNPCYQQTEDFLACLRANPEEIALCQAKMDSLI